MKNLTLILGILIVNISLHSATLLKYATMAPEGSIWAKYAKKMQTEIQAQTNGEVKLKVFYGSIAGDERTVLKKMRSGSIDIASFTGQTMGEIVPETRILELPFFFENTAQIDKVIFGMYPEYSEKFRKKGYILAGWGEAGFVYLMTKKKPVLKVEDMEGLKIWAPKGDELVKAMLQEYGLVPVYLGFESVLPQLQTGGLDAIYAPPMAAIGLQWFRDVKYLSNVKLANAAGGTLMSQVAYAKLSAEHAQIVHKVLEKQSRALIVALRKENEKSLNILYKNGIEKKDITDSEKKRLKDTALKVQNKLVGKLYTSEQLKKARKLRDGK